MQPGYGCCGQIFVNESYSRSRDLLTEYQYRASCCFSIAHVIHFVINGTHITANIPVVSIKAVTSGQSGLLKYLCRNKNEM